MALLVFNPAFGAFWQYDVFGERYVAPLTPEQASHIGQEGRGL